VIRTVESGKVTASHDVSLGGLAAALCKMCVNMGASADLTSTGQEMRADDVLFSESYSRAIITTSEPEAVEKLLGNIPHTVIGTAGGSELKITGNGFSISVQLEEIKEAEESLTKLMME
jgi:phosphoribosylformylglycinamidine synthase